MNESAMMCLSEVSKTFVLHHQHSATINVLNSFNLQAEPGECVVLDGPSGIGKSTVLKLIYATYRATKGQIWIRPSQSTPAIELSTANTRLLLALRRDVIGYVSQFLRVIPRVSALEIVAEPLLELANGDVDQETKARESAATLLDRLNIPQRLWGVPPATFSGGEQQRINIARGFIRHRPILLLDEPTASLDIDNQQIVVQLIKEARDKGACIIGIFHDALMRESVATRLCSMQTLMKDV
jgi:alpha-D-ribose 1-methylphosphonate 5-triphosphate synthase subunit PhnL